jgi:hypothetical protein
MHTKHVLSSSPASVIVSAKASVVVLDDLVLRSGFVINSLRVLSAT